MCSTTSVTWATGTSDTSGCWRALSESQPGTLPRPWRGINGWIGAAAAAFLLAIPTLHRTLGGRYYETIGPVLEALAVTLIVRWTVQFPDSLAGRFLNAGPI